VEDDSSISIEAVVCDDAGLPLSPGLVKTENGSLTSSLAIEELNEITFAEEEVPGPSKMEAKPVGRGLRVKKPNVLYTNTAFWESH
jgi:hypothetical protein